ncbi:hypothetical protein KAR91_34720 [Candidatus Pacearchaeota archaeon]|nr:hypothetical protein [Candidatus Pacearchaeota archaeon]
MTSDYRPRLSIELTELQQAKLFGPNGFISWGQGRALFSVICDDLIDLFETVDDVGLALSAVISRGIKAREVIKVMKEMEERGNK